VFGVDVRNRQKKGEKIKIEKKDEEKTSCVRWEKKK
jgi:hypothetical protein